MIHSNKRKGKAHIIISTGEEKVLDKIKCPFMINILIRVGITK